MAPKEATYIVKPKRTGLDVLQQFQAAIRIAQTNASLVERAAFSMTPEQLRKAHEGLTVLASCLASTAMQLAATAAPIAIAEKPSAAPRPASARRSEPATESA